MAVALCLRVPVVHGAGRGTMGRLPPPWRDPGIQRAGGGNCLQASHLFEAFAVMSRRDVEGAFAEVGTAWRFRMRGHLELPVRSRPCLKGTLQRWVAGASAPCRSRLR
jgi:hypothetical protein